MNPRVFVSHASEDKERFVLEFARRLREQGIDAWGDKWEMIPGDSLVDKIFEEGIKGASAVIVVLSKFSVQKPWVKEELNAAFVKRINSGSKLIPIIIDDCNVPEVLKHTFWEHIPNTSSYDENLKRIVSSVFGITDKPPLGSPPPYVQSLVKTIGSLNRIDSLILKLSCEYAIENGSDFIEPDVIFRSDQIPGILKEELEESLEMLEREGDINITHLVGVAFCPYQITTSGFRSYAEACVPDYQERIASVISAIVNEGLMDSDAIKVRLNENETMVAHILALLRDQGHIRLAELIGGISRIVNVSPALKRMLRG